VVKGTVKNFSNSALVFNITAQALQVVFVPLLTFYFDLEEYGSWVLLLAIAGVIGVGSSLRLDHALQLSNSKDELDQIVFTGRVTSILIPWVCFLFSCVVVPSRIEFSIQCASIASLIGLNSIQISKSYKIRHYKRVIVGQTFISLGFPVFAIALSKSPGGANSLFFASLIGYTCSIGINLEYRIWPKKTGPKHFKNRVNRIPRTILNSKKYIQFSLPATGINMIKEQIPLYTLFLLSGNAAVAIFSLGMRIINVPNSLFTSVLRPKFANELTENLGKSTQIQILAGEIREVLKFLGVMLSCLVVVLYGFTDFLVQNAFDKNWENLGNSIRILGVLMIPQVLIGWLDRTLDLMGKQALILRYELFSIVLLLILLAVSRILQLNDTYYMSIYSAIILILYLWLMITTLELNKIDKRYVLAIFLRLIGQITVQTIGLLLLKTVLSDIYALILVLLVNVIILKKKSNKLPDWFW
jgi:O-antigen/teichoic acid export membrane protein